MTDVRTFTAEIAALRDRMARLEYHRFDGYNRFDGYSPRAAITLTERERDLIVSALSPEPPK